MLPKLMRSDGSHLQADSINKILPREVKSGKLCDVDQKNRLRKCSPSNQDHSEFNRDYIFHHFQVGFSHATGLEHSCW